MQAGGVTTAIGERIKKSGMRFGKRVLIPVNRVAGWSEPAPDNR